jgi:hypothetical protein
MALGWAVDLSSSSSTAAKLANPEQLETMEAIEPECFPGSALCSI